MTKREAGEAVPTAMEERGLSLAELAVEMERPRVWITAAVRGACGDCLAGQLRCPRVSVADAGVLGLAQWRDGPCHEHLVFD
jgi:hypothetical protein